ncbi:hypothetical protein [Roseomonas indoligenes]|uniref:Uncharacterized protein n=1 Tax=Roseomonas indoligenes TaxID=2820811 RepID=A0A940S675_9PROT|nr:hypothetical protein [Pararoseomonas indoligenes]MBP0495221.1 hypothetical protein [Pararoseomonas indoligenes]
MPFHPYADEAATLRIGELTAENRLDRVSLHGSLDLTRDRAGLDRARRLKGLVDAALAVLEAEADRLPEAVETGGNTDSVRNPFG